MHTWSAPVDKEMNVNNHPMNQRTDGVLSGTHAGAQRLSRARRTLGGVLVACALLGFLETAHPPAGSRIGDLTVTRIDSAAP